MILLGAFSWCYAARLKSVFGKIKLKLGLIGKSTVGALTKDISRDYPSALF